MNLSFAFMWTTRVASPPDRAGRAFPASSAFVSLRRGGCVLAFCVLAGRAARRRQQSIPACRGCPVVRRRSWARHRAQAAVRSETCRAQADSWAAERARSLPRAFPPQSRRPAAARAPRNCKCRCRLPSRNRSRPRRRRSLGRSRSPARTTTARPTASHSTVPSTSRSSGAWISGVSFSRSRWRGPTFSRPAFDPTPSSIKTVSCCNITAPAPSSRGLPPADRASSTPTSVTRSISRTSARHGPASQASRSEFSRPSTRMPCATASTTSTPPTRPRWVRGRRCVTRAKA